MKTEQPCWNDGEILKSSLIFILGLLFFYFFYISDSASQPRPRNHSWALLYYMPYDNNLAVYADTVEHMISSGIISTDVVAAIFRDDSRKDVAEIISLEKGHAQRIPTLFEKSNSIKSLQFFLQWAKQNVHADHTAFIFLDHGGCPTELCLDEFPEKGFLSIDSVRIELINFTESTGKPFDLLFLQVCAKAAIEPLYELKDCANYTLASENVLGAPNYYYKNVISSISNETTAPDLAKRIAQEERLDMFYSLTLTDKVFKPINCLSSGQRQ